MYLALPIALLILFLSGCVRIDIETGIDADFTAYLTYHISLDVNEIDSRYQNEIINALNNIGWHYQEHLGFAVGVNTESAPFTLTMVRQVDNDSFEQAFYSLEKMLTNEDMTLFMQVDMAIQDFFQQERYILGAAADIPQIMRLSNVEELSTDMQQELEKAMKEGQGTITLALPASEVINSTHQVNIQNNRAVMVVPLDYTDRTGFELAAKLNLLDDGTPGGALEEIVSEQIRLRTIAFYICYAALAILFTALLLIIVSIRRKERSA